MVASWFPLAGRFARLFLPLVLAALVASSPCAAQDDPARETELAPQETWVFQDDATRGTTGIFLGPSPALVPAIAFDGAGRFWVAPRTHIGSTNLMRFATAGPPPFPQPPTDRSINVALRAIRGMAVDSAGRLILLGRVGSPNCSNYDSCTANTIARVTLTDPATTETFPAGFGSYEGMLLHPNGNLYFWYTLIVSGDGLPTVFVDAYDPNLQPAGQFQLLLARSVSRMDADEAGNLLVDGTGGESGLTQAVRRYSLTGNLVDRYLGQAFDSYHDGVFYMSVRNAGGGPSECATDFEIGSGTGVVHRACAYSSGSPQLAPRRLGWIGSFPGPSTNGSFGTFAKVSPDGQLFVITGSEGVLRFKRTFRTVLGSLSAQKLPNPRVLAAQRRPASTLVDIDYRVEDADTANLESWLLGFDDGVVRFDKLIRLTALVEGTASNVGTGRPSGQVLRVTWDAGVDAPAAGGFRQVQFFALASDRAAPIEIHYIDLPAGVPNGPDPLLRISVSPLRDRDFFNYWLWLLARGQSGLAVSGDTVVGTSGPFNGMTLASGTQTTAQGRDYLFALMGVRAATPAEVTRARNGTTPGVQEALPVTNAGDRNPILVNEIGFDVGATQGVWVVQP